VDLRHPWRVNTVRGEERRHCLSAAQTATQGFRFASGLTKAHGRGEAIPESK
jgi:hypothetical protein